MKNSLFETEIESPIYKEKPGIFGFSMWLIFTIFHSLWFTSWFKTALYNDPDIVFEVWTLSNLLTGVICGFIAILLVKAVGYLFDRIPPNEFKIQNLGYYFTLYGFTFWYLTFFVVIILILIIPFKLIYSAFWNH